MKASESGGQVRREAEERAGANDRKYERFSTDLNATLLRGKTSIEGRVVDVSFTGMFFTTFEPPPLRDLVKIDLELPSGERLRLLGMAVHLVRPGRHRRRPGVGVQLFGNGEGVLAAWDQFVKAVRADHLAAPKKKEPDEPKPEASDEPLDHAPVIDPLDRPTIAEPLDPAPVIEPRDRPTIADPLDPTSVVEPRDRSALDPAQAVDPLDHPTIADPLDPASAVDPLAAPTIADPLDHPTIAEPKPLFPEEVEPTPTAVGLPTAMPLPARLPTANLTPIHTTEIALAHDRSDAIEQAVEDAFDALEMEGDPFPDDFGPGDVAPGPEAHGRAGRAARFFATGAPHSVGDRGRSGLAAPPAGAKGTGPLSNRSPHADRHGRAAARDAAGR